MHVPSQAAGPKAGAAPPSSGLLLHFLFLLFRAVPVAYESFQDRGLIGAAAATATAMWDPSCVCNLHHSLQQLWILNPLNEARDRTLNLMDPSRVRYN